MKRRIALTCALLLVACSEGDDRSSNVPSQDEGASAETSGIVEAAGPLEAGERIFAQCSACHALEPGLNRMGPSLHNIVGREAGTVSGFAYSPALRKSGITWTEDELSRYLESPQGAVPGTRMAFAGLPDPVDRAAVIAYLQAHAR